MSTHAEPVRSSALDAIIKDAGGTALPDNTPDEPHFTELIDECAQLLHTINFVKVQDKQVAHATFPAAGPKITYDSTFTMGNANIDEAAFRTACILHEIMHVSVDSLYEQHPDPNERGVWRSYNFHYTSSQGKNLDKQCEIAEANLLKVKAFVAADNSLPIEVRDHIDGRVEYGLPTAITHWDTVLFDILVYLRILGYTSKNISFAYLTKLSQQAKTHRLDPNRGPMPVAPAT
ncbi:hypothetical protein ACFW9L_20395 [Streptomyces sp. NPDC059517]|uniref:hypothetical protein n=1 Tax=Streptomyces sp. NPDC059517 TaxID=3346855 RepID=UPI00368FF271